MKNDRLMFSFEIYVEVEGDKYFVEGLDNELLADISILNIQERTKDIKSFIKFFRQAIDGQYKKYNNITSIERLCEIMVSILPYLSQYVLLIEYHFHQLLLCHRSSCKLYSVLLGIFSELLQKGFCIPSDEKEMEGEGATSFEDAENCGIGEGEGRKDVSNQIENEEQVMVKYYKYLFIYFPDTSELELQQSSNISYTHIMEGI